MKLIGKVNGIEFHSSDLVPKGEVFVINGKIVVDPNQYNDVQSFLKGDDVNNDALLDALDKINNTALNPAVMSLPQDDEEETYDYDIEGPDVDENPFKDKNEPKKKKGKIKTKTFKADKMANGFIFQSNPLAEGKEPFYMEAYLLGNNEIYISGGMAGLLNGDEAKQLRKHLKMLISQLSQSYPDPDKEKGGKAILKVNAPWVPTDEQLTIIAEMVKKETKKVLEKLNTEPDEQILDFIQTIALHTAVTTISQLEYEPHDAADTPINFQTPAPMIPGEKTALLKADFEITPPDIEEELATTPELYDFSKLMEESMATSATPPKVKVTINDGKATMNIDGESLEDKKSLKKKKGGLKFKDGLKTKQAELNAATLALLDDSDNATVEEYSA